MVAIFKRPENLSRTDCSFKLNIQNTNCNRLKNTRLHSCIDMAEKMQILEITRITLILQPSQLSLILIINIFLKVSFGMNSFFLRQDRKKKLLDI